MDDLWDYLFYRVGFDVHTSDEMIYHVAFFFELFVYFGSVAKIQAHDWGFKLAEECFLSKISSFEKATFFFQHTFFDNFHIAFII